MNKFTYVFLVSAMANDVAQAGDCTAQQKREIVATYESFRSASRAGNLSQVKELSTSAVVSEVVKFEKTAPDAASLARQMSAFLPGLSYAKDLQCEYSQKRARLIIKTETAEQVLTFTQEDRPSKVIPASVVMFEHVHGSKWLVGVKASTSPFSPEPIESLLKHEILQLP